jgi:hypothetical protein
MEKRVFRSLVVVLGVLILVGSAIAQDSMVIAPSYDFRVNVETNRDVYHNRDVLRLTVELLNDSPSQIRIMQFEEPVPLDPVRGEISDGVLDDDAVDVVVRPYYPTIIGYARLIPLDYDIRTMIADGFAPEIPFRLPLFGSPVVQPHSTRIISTANILIGCAVIAEPVDVRTDAEKAVFEGERVEVDSVGKYWAVGPGRYLLEVNIDKIGGVKIAQAQKIVLIKPRRANDTIKILRDNNAGIKRIEKRTHAIAETSANTYRYTIYNNKYIRAIYRFLTGSNTRTDGSTDTTTRPETTTTKVRRSR